MSSAKMAAILSRGRWVFTSTNADLLAIGPIGIDFNEILNKMRFNLSLILRENIDGKM